MKFVEIIDNNRDKVIGRVVIKNRKIEFEGDLPERMVHDLKTFGVFGEEGVVKINEPTKFLRNLRFEIRGTNYSTSLIKEE